MRGLLFPFLLIAVIFYGCSGTRGLSENETYARKLTIKFVNPETIENKGKLEEGLMDQAKPKLNSKFLGLFRIKLWLYLHVKEPKKDKGFKHWLKYKLGEKPSYYDAGE